MRRPATRNVRGRAALAGALASVGALACACSSTPAAAPTTTAATTPTTTAPPATVTLPPTTTVPVPPSPQPSAQAAASALVSSWATGNRNRALTVAVPAAVNVLFAVPYPGSLAGSRGCTSAFPPIVCTYGPPGGGNSNDPIYQIYASQSPGGWYVSNAVIEH
jgi:hypothetical protein